MNDELGSVEARAKELVIDDVVACMCGECGFDRLMQLGDEIGFEPALTMWTAIVVTYIGIFASESGEDALMQSIAASIVHATSSDTQSLSYDFVIGCLARFPDDIHSDAMTEYTRWIYEDWVKTDDADRSQALIEGLHMLKHIAAELTENHKGLLHAMRNPHSMN